MRRLFPKQKGSSHGTSYVGIIATYCTIVVCTLRPTFHRAFMFEQFSHTGKFAEYRDFIFW